MSADVKSIIYSQIHLGYFSEYLLVKNRSIQSATCKLCSEPLTELHHEIINCKVLLKVIDSFKTLISKLGRTETLSQQELAFGTLANSNKEQLRNFIVFIIRSIVHKSRETVFRNQGQAIDKIINIAKQKMQKEIWNKFHLAVEKGCVQQFADKYLTGNILGTLNNGILKLTDALKI